MSLIGIVFDVKEIIDVEELRRYLRVRYGDFGEFFYWLKGEGFILVFDIINVIVNKGRVFFLLFRYYGVDLDYIIVFGDGFNDVFMFKVVIVFVVLGNVFDLVKRYVIVRLKKINKDGVVGEYIDKFLDNFEKEIVKLKVMVLKMRKVFI